MDFELEKLYRQLKNAPAISKEKDLITSELIKVCDSAQTEGSIENLKAMLELLAKSGESVETNPFIPKAGDNTEKPNTTKTRKGKFITERIGENIFTNIKKQVRQSNKIRIENYSNTNSRLVKEINVAPLSLKQYSIWADK